MTPILKRGDVIILQISRNDDRQLAEDNMTAVQEWFQSYGIDAQMIIETVNCPASVVAIIRED